jgi:hypothetical protein
MDNIKDFERLLMQKLNQYDLDKTFLKRTSTAIVNLKRQGLVIDQVSIKGKVHVDRILINGIIDPNFWKHFNQIDNLSRFKVFPYGIINPEGFRFEGYVR